MESGDIIIQDLSGDYRILMKPWGRNFRYIQRNNIRYKCTINSVNYYKVGLAERSKITCTIVEPVIKLTKI